jgi:glycosyltransferase involved in cell wall biosynthesis
VILPALAARRSADARMPLFIDWCDWWGRGGTQADRPGHPLVKGVYGPVETWFEEAFRTRADWTTVASTALLERAAALGVPRDRISMLPGGSETETFPIVPAAEARAAIGLPPGGRLVGYVGAITKPELARLLEVVRALRSEWEDVRLLAVGLSVAGTSVQLKDLLSDAESAWVIDTGRVPHDRMPVYTAAADVLLLPLADTVSNRGRWPSKLNDYLSAARPVVSTRIGDLVPLFERHRPGLLAADATADLAAAVTRLLADRELARTCGDAGRRLAEGELNWRTLVGALAGHYERVLQRSGGGVAGA